MNITPRLTLTEIKVLKYLIEGARNKEISTALNVSDRTIKNHTKHIYDKFGIIADGSSSREKLIRMFGYFEVKVQWIPTGVYNEIFGSNAVEPVPVHEPSDPRSRPTQRSCAMERVNNTERNV